MDTRLAKIARAVNVTALLLLGGLLGVITATGIERGLEARPQAARMASAPIGIVITNSVSEGDFLFPGDKLLFTGPFTNVVVYSTDSDAWRRVYTGTNTTAVTPNFGQRPVQIRDPGGTNVDVIVSL